MDPSTDQRAAGEARPGRRDNEALADRLGVIALSLEVVDARALTPSCRRVRLGGDDLAALDPLPGQDLMLSLDLDGDRTRRRRYTIRHYDHERCLVDLDVALHGDGPGRRWATVARTGDLIEAIGPRGKITLDPDAEWHLFFGDDSFAPAALNMAEAVNPNQTVVLAIEIDGDGHEQPSEIGATVEGPRWVVRQGALGNPQALEAALADTALPTGTGHAYVGGEHAMVTRLRDVLIARGMDADRVSFKPYWRRGRQNALNGEPDRG
ncbi:MAG: siderophore-interacting protein [Acidimicrobiales bacterium]